VHAQAASPVNPATNSGAGSSAAVDLTRQPTLYVIPYSHLDTQWLWDYTSTINEYLPNTMRINFDYFAKYPHYLFNFTGSNRYRLMKEYYPAQFDTLRQWVARGRWYPGGSSVEEGDVNAPNAESIFRQILYSNEWFKREFGVTSSDYMLPDCFGFPSSMPSIMAHAGIIGFSTQKLSAKWQPAAHVGGPGSVEETPAGIPFNVGVWYGPDGKSVLAALNPGRYDNPIDYDLSAPLPPSKEPRPAAMVDWPSRIERNGKASGIYADYRYTGDGDFGGAVDDHSAQVLEALVTGGTVPIGYLEQDSSRRNDTTRVQVGRGPVRVLPAFTDQIFHDLRKTGALDRLPKYRGELELINHSAGSLSSQAALKRWNRQNEVLADAAERASVAAAWLGGRPYPRERLNDAWTLVLGAQFHDILAGTSVPKVYELSWNDEVIAMNQFAGVITSATSAVASQLDTRVRGTAVVVYNPLNIAREDLVHVIAPRGRGDVRVDNALGQSVPAQQVGDTVIFVAQVPSVGYAVYDLRRVPHAPRATSQLIVTDSTLENQRYRVRIDAHGDVSSIVDKRSKKELLSAPMRLAFQTERPAQYPAWNMDWDDQRKPPRGYVDGPATVRVVERGPARVALEITRKSDSSTFVQTVRLSAGDAGNRVEFGNVIDWRTSAAALKAVLPSTAVNAEATYTWDIGTIRRATNDERHYEVGSHQWIDLTDTSKTFGVTYLTDCKNGSDKPDDHTLRLTLIYTPGIKEGVKSSYRFQTSNDWGRHTFIYGLAAHGESREREATDWQGYRLNQPLLAMMAPSHPGRLGKSFSLLTVSSPRIRVLAVKQAEASDDIIVRAVALDSTVTTGVRLAFASPVISAQEVDGQERPVGAATVVGGAVVTDFGPFQPRTFAIRLTPPKVPVAAPVSHPIILPYDRAVASNDKTSSPEGFDDQGNTLPAELLPSSLDFGGVHFELASAKTGVPNAVVARGQTIALPKEPVTRVYVLAAMADTDRAVTFHVGTTPVNVAVQRWGGYVGSWDNRIWQGGVEAHDEVIGVSPGFVKRDDIAWYASHHHSNDGANHAYEYSYLFAYALDVPKGATTVTLPNAPGLRVMAMTGVQGDTPVKVAYPLYDTMARETH